MYFEISETWLYSFLHCQWLPPQAGDFEQGPAVCARRCETYEGRAGSRDMTGVSGEVAEEQQFLSPGQSGGPAWESTGHQGADGTEPSLLAPSSAVTHCP